VRALADGLLVGVDLADVFDLRAGIGEEIVVDLDAHRAHDAEVVTHHEVIDRVHAARGAVFKRQHAVAAKALFDGGKHRLEGREKEGVRALKELFAGLLGVCALHALTGNGGFLREKMRRLFDRLGDLRGQVAPRAEQTALAAAAQFKNERIERGNVFSQILGRFFHERAHLFLFVSRVEHAQAVCLLVGGDLLRRFHALGEQRDQLIVDLVDLFAIVVQIHSFYLVSFLRASSAS